jgi:hypothetical protein
MSSPKQNLSSTLSQTCASLFVAAATLGSLPASAGTWSEVGDAGQTQLSAQVTGSNRPLNSITGNLSSDTDPVDLYLINIFDPNGFSAATSGPVELDTQLMLFTLSGDPVYMNDDEPSGNTFWSLLPQGSGQGPLSAGMYLLAVTLAGFDAFNEVNQALFDIGFSSTDIRGPAFGLSPAFLYAFGGTSTFQESGAYEIALTGTNGVPEPSTWLLAALACGLCGQASSAGRRNRSKTNAPA